MNWLADSSTRVFDFYENDDLTAFDMSRVLHWIHEYTLRAHDIIINENICLEIIDHVYLATKRSTYDLVDDIDIDHEYRNHDVLIRLMLTSAQIAYRQRSDHDSKMNIENLWFNKLTID